MNIIDQDGYELIEWPSRLAQYMLEIFVVDADGAGDSIAKELAKPMSSEAKPSVERLPEA